MTSIQEIAEKIKGWLQAGVPKLPVLPDDLFLGLIIILVAFGSFGLGRLSKIEGSKTPIRIENAPEITADTFLSKIPTNTLLNPPELGSDRIDGDLVGSKNGTKYYYPWCASVQKIAPANIIHFTNVDDAEAQGYTKSANCKGL